MTRTIAEKRAAFRALHERAASSSRTRGTSAARATSQGLGFKALATTSSGCAWSHGQARRQRCRATTVLAHLRAMVAATDLPVNADFESGFAAMPRRRARACGSRSRPAWPACRSRIRPAIATSRCATSTIAVERMRAARAAIDETGGDTLLVGRAENFFVGRPDLDDTIAPAARPTPRPARIASMRRASRRASRSRPWSPRWRPSPSTC